jgi:cytochrome c oxidase subunit II
MKKSLGFLLVLVIWLAGCGGSEKYPQLPADMNLDTVPKQTVAMTAERYTFSPEEVHVKAGTLVTLEVTAVDGTHGISLPDYGIDVSLPEKHPVAVRFYAATKGEHSFSCSHLCGIGHFWMGGKIIVE